MLDNLSETRNLELDMQNKSPTIGLAVIGDEILLGEVADENLAWISSELFRLGADLRYSCVLPDDLSFIVEHLDWMRERFQWVITTGGIGATHDDLTRQAVANVLGVELEENAEVILLLEEKVKRPLTEKLRDLAKLPAGSRLVANPVTAAPGFIAGNIISLPGIPKLIQSMFGELTELLRGETLARSELFTDRYESEIAEVLSEAQEKFSKVKIGSYPIMEEGFRVKLVLRSRSGSELTEAMEFLKKRINA